MVDLTWNKPSYVHSLASMQEGFTCTASGASAANLMMPKHTPPQNTHKNTHAHSHLNTNHVDVEVCRVESCIVIYIYIYRLDDVRHFVNTHSSVTYRVCVCVSDMCVNVCRCVFCVYVCVNATHESFKFSLWQFQPTTHNPPIDVYVDQYTHSHKHTFSTTL